jgi:hypothetical protein
MNVTMRFAVHFFVDHCKKKYAAVIAIFIRVALDAKAIKPWNIKNDVKKSAGPEIFFNV